MAHDQKKLLLEGGDMPPKNKPQLTDRIKDSMQNIIDIRRDKGQISLTKDIYAGLQAQAGEEKTLPTLLLYDEAGLKLFEDITYLEEYYLTNAEIDILKTYAEDIAKRLQPSSILVELGSGNLRKVNILLRAIESLCKEVDYYALDLSKTELERTLSAIPHKAFKHVTCNGLWGTYEDGLAWLETGSMKTKSKTILWMGSSIGNFSREDAANFLENYVRCLRPGDTMVIGNDACLDSERVQLAYNDPHGVTTDFTLNGLWNANNILGAEVFEPSVWQHVGKFDPVGRRHQAFVFPNKDVNILGVSVKAGEKIRIEESYKYNSADLEWLWHRIGALEKKKWSNSAGDYAMHEIAKGYGLPPNPSHYAAQPAPSPQEWSELWQIWDTVTRQMLPDEELLEKPIKLRNACIFYLGHIPGFFDIKLTEVYPEEGPTEPAYFHQIFERGIDPDVDNPEHCHAHSEIPDTWPALEEILAYQDDVRNRVRRMYTNGESSTVKGGRALWLGYEHEAMHLETLLYMLIQSEKTLPPSGVPSPSFEKLAESAKAARVPNEWFAVPERDLTIGMVDPETDDGPIRYYGWDVEKPVRMARVKSFQARGRPITNGEYAQYLHETGKNTIPASWVQDPTLNGHVNGHEVKPTNGHTNGHTNGYTNGHIGLQTNGSVHAEIPESILAGRKIRTVFGAIPLKYALDWPVSASYDELAGCALWMGGRIPTLEETRSIYEHVDALKTRGTAQRAATIPAVNNHLVNAGVAESPPASQGLSNGNGANGATKMTPPANGAATKADGTAIEPSSLFVDLSGSNVGFQNWTPTPVTANGNKLAGQGDMGGLWEWTSTPLSRQEGFEPMRLYPAYSADFHDGKHNIVLGGSWATVPRIAGRRSFVNWYQRNYPFVWAGARVVKDN